MNGAISPELTALAQTPAAREPVRYTGALTPDPAFFDGRVPHAVGVHHSQVYRASRSTADGGLGYTYNHQPFLVFWRGRFYLHFLSAPQHEHQAPTVTLLSASADGYQWSRPEILFPEYRLPPFTIDGVIYAAGMPAVMHQRMGFYVAPNDRLLAVGFYGICPDSEHSPNAGNGVGRVVREIHADGTRGAIYFVRYNRHAGFDERNTTFPFYQESLDAEFRAACDALLADRLVTLQWWEEDRARDGFYAINPGAVPDAPRFDAAMVTSEGAGKAFTWYTRPDGVVVGLWKNRYSALSPDRGRSWTPIVRNPTLRTTGAKTWGQRTSDGRYAIVYNHSATCANRFPISALIGSDGHLFPELLCLGGEVPPRRFAGKHKGVGAHYFRGISEGGPQPSDGGLWVTYSINKEDIWVMRATVPVTATAAPAVRDDFAAATTTSDLAQWNLYSPRWAPIALVPDEAVSRRVLELRSTDPVDYAQAERVFPALHRGVIRFAVRRCLIQASAGLEIEVQTQRHERPIQLRLTSTELEVDATAAGRVSVAWSDDAWHNVELSCDCAAAQWTLRINGVERQRALPFAESASALERIVFRTGPWRGRVPAHLVDGAAAGRVHLPGEDLPVADEPQPPVVFRLSQLTITPS